MKTELKNWEEILTESKWYDFLFVWQFNISNAFWNFLRFFKNAFRFRKVLCQYEPWDYWYDIDFLTKAFELKVKSFEVGCEFAEVGRELNEIKAIYNDLLSLREFGGYEDEFYKTYERIFTKLKKSYKFWW